MVVELEAKASHPKTAPMERSIQAEAEAVAEGLVLVARAVQGSSLSGTRPTAATAFLQARPAAR
jgi:hypothetical protein